MSKAKDNYNEKTYDRATVRFKKGQKEVFEQLAIQKQTSLNGLINDLLQKALENAEKEGKE